MKPDIHKKHSSTLCILPTALMAEEELKKIARETGVVTGYRVMTFPELMNILAKDFPVKLETSSIGEILLIKDAVDSISKDTGDIFFSDVKNSPIFYRSLNKFIKELKQAIITAADFEKAVKALNIEKYTLLAKIYSSYEKSLSCLNLTDNIGSGWTIMKGFEGYNDLPASLSAVEEIIIKGFYDLLPIQRRIVNAIINKGVKPQIIPIYNLENPDATKASESLLNFFETMEDLSPDSIIFSHASRTDNGTAIGCLMDNFLKENKSSDFIKDDTVNLIAAPGRYKEVEEIGREVRRLLAKGVNPSDIGIVFRDIAPYGEIIIDVFKRFNMPLYFKRGMPLLASPIIKNILSIYDIVESNFEREKVLKLLNSDYVDYSGIANGKDIKIDDMERIAGEAKIINEDIEKWDKAIDRYIKRNSKDSETGTAVKGLIANFIRHLKRLDKKQTFAQHKDALYEIMERLSINDKRLAGDEYIKMRDALSLKVFNDAINEIEKTFSTIKKNNLPLSLNEFLGIIMESLREKTVPVYNNRSGIKALSILDARGLKFKHLFVCGLNDGEFPKLESPHAFIREDDKKRLNRVFHRKIFLTSNAKWWEEPLLFMLVLGMAEEKVYLSYSYLDEKGREASPSIFFREALNILKINEKCDDRFKKIPVSDVIAKPEDALEKDELIISVVKALNSSNKTYAEELLELIGDREGFKENISRLLKLNSMERSRDIKDEDAPKWTGCFVDNDLISHLRKEFLGDGNIWTATMLETLAKCPFSFYMKYILKLDEKEEPDIEMDNLTQGNILHRILERFYKTAKDKGMLPLKGNDKESELLIKETRFIFEDIEKNGFIGNKRLWDIKKNKIMSISNRFYKDEAERHDKEFIPEHFEIEFGQGKHIPLLNIILSDNETIRINGKIDRIDAAQNGLRIIDYKTGSAPKPDEIGKIYFQIPLYVLAASNLYAQRLKYSGFYYLLKKMERKEIKTIKDENGDIPIHEYIFNSQNRTLAKDIDALISNIKSGNFKAEPHNEKTCANCRFWSVCRYAGTGKEENSDVS